MNTYLTKPLFINTGGKLNKIDVETHKRYLFIVFLRVRSYIFLIIFFGILVFIVYSFIHYEFLEILLTL